MKITLLFLSIVVALNRVVNGVLSVGIRMAVGKVSTAVTHIAEEWRGVAY
jgi:hypothetical protein